MNLLEARTAFVKRTGRVDLVGTTTEEGDLVPDYTVDNGANAYLHQAIRLLDFHTKSRGKRTARVLDIEQGEYSVFVENCMIVQKVYIRTATERLPLEAHTIDELMTEYLQPFEEIDTGTPAYFALGDFIKEDNDEPDDEDEEEAWQRNEEVEGLQVIILPPTDEDLKLEIIGYFYSDMPEEDDDEGFWLARHGDVVVNLSIDVLNGTNLNPASSRTIGSIVEFYQRKMISIDIANEIVAQGGAMREPTL